MSKIELSESCRKYAASVKKMRLSVLPAFLIHNAAAYPRSHSYCLSLTFRLQWYNGLIIILACIHTCVWSAYVHSVH